MSIPKVDWGNVVRSVYDPSTNSVRTTAQAVVPTGSIEISLDATTDSVQLGDGTHLSTLTPDPNGTGRVGVDVNILSGAVTGQFAQTGLSTAIRTIVMTVDSTPAKVPSSPLSHRNSISVRVWGSSTVYFGSSSVDTASGYPKMQYEELVLDVKDNASVEIWAVCASGQTCELRVIELA